MDSRFSLSAEDYQEQWNRGWPDVHPEDFCQRCHNRNVTWYVDSDRFNLAAEALGFRSTSILCIACFVEGHQKATGLTCSWQLLPGTHFAAIEILDALASLSEQET